MNLNSPAMIAATERFQRIVAIRQHTLGVTDTCPACEEGKGH